jgi:hypothetical protein
MNITLTIQVGNLEPVIIRLVEEDGPASPVRPVIIGGTDIASPLAGARKPGRREQVVLDTLAGWDGNWEVTEIARKSGVPISGVYTSCNSLASRGLIRQVSVKPMMYRLAKASDLNGEPDA